MAAAGCSGRSTAPVMPSLQTAAAVSDAKGTKALDAAVMAFMKAHQIRAGQLAVVKNGKVLFSHAYTNSSDPKYPKTKPSSIMRIASESKAFSYLAGWRVETDGLVSANTKAFPFLHVKAPLLKSQHPDPNINAITVDELLHLNSGLTGEEPEPDPAGPGPVRSAERGAGNKGPLSVAQFNGFLYGYPLAGVPGATPNQFTNAGYYAIDRVVEQAAHRPYWSYIQKTFLSPIGVHDAVLSHTSRSEKRPNEVTYDSDITNYSVLKPRSNGTVPCPYGGNFLFEVVDSAAVAISTDSYARFIDKYYSPNYPSQSYWTGFMCGTSSYTSFYAKHPTYSFTFNAAINEFSPEDPFVKQIDALVKQIFK